MSSNQHRNLTGSALHNPKGFDSADESTYLTKDSNGSIYFAKVLRLPNALNVVSGQSAPPTEVSGDVYLIDTTGTAYDIDTITWQSGNTIRYTFNGSPDLSAIAADDYFVTSGNTNSSNDGVFVISDVNDGSDYIEITNVNRDDNTDDEATDAIGTGYYTLAEWDGVQKNSHARFDGNDWVILSPNNGDTCFDETSAELLIFNGTTWNDILASSGDVSQSGTSSDNQIAVFTADKTIEGDDNFTFSNGQIETFAEDSSSYLKLTSYSDTVHWANNLSFYSANGTSSTPTALLSGEVIGKVIALGHNGSSFISAGNDITFSASENWSVGNNGTQLQIRTTLNGASGAAQRLLIDGSGDITLGNYKFDGDQTVGAGQDDYVLTYDNATGLISLEAAAGGGSSEWDDTSDGGIGFNGTGSGSKRYIEINDSTANTYSGGVTNGELVVGLSNTLGTGTVRRGAVIGVSNTVGSVTTSSQQVVIGQSNTIESGTDSLVVGNSNTYKTGKNNSVMFGSSNTMNGTDSFIAGNLNTVNADYQACLGWNQKLQSGVNYQIAIGKTQQITASHDNSGIFFSMGSARPNISMVNADSANAMNMAMGSYNSGRTTDGAGLTGTGGGVFYWMNAQTVAPTVDLPNAAGIYGKDRTAGKSGLIIKAEDGSEHFFSDFSAIGGNETDANANKTLTIVGTGTGSGTSSLLCEDSGGTANFEVRDDGVIIMASLPTSSAGLPTGALWNNSGVLNIV